MSVIETVLAMGISCVIAVQLDTLIFVLFSTCLAPLLLLKTPMSENLAIDWFEFFHECTHDWIDLLAETAAKGEFLRILVIVCLPVVLLVPVILSIPIKVAATAYSFFKQPLMSINAIGTNWYRMSFVIDMSYKPEILPGYESRELDCNIYKLSTFKKDKDRSNAVWLIIAPAWLFAFIPALLYRWSIKSTSIIYLPLLWIMRPVSNKVFSLRETLIAIKESEIARIVRIYSWFVIIFLTVFPVLFNAQLQDLFSLLNEKTKLAVVANIWFPVLTISPWHITRALGALITIGLFFYADHQLRTHSGKFTAIQKRTVRSLLTLKNIIGLYTSVCGIYLLYISIDWPSVNWRWLPWL